MAEEKKEKWLNYLSATTVLIAVCATLSTFKGGGYSTKSILFQSKASDQWAYYQAKSIKLNLCEMQKDNLELELSRLGNKENTEAIQKKIDSYSDKIKKYTQEKEQISNDAKGLESIRDDSKKHSENFGIAVIFLQIAILISSISALVKKKPLWYISVVIGVVGVVYFFDGFFLFF